jgi:hypothetical protein
MNLMMKTAAATALLTIAATASAQGRLIGITGTGIWEISMTDASRVQIGTLAGTPGTIGELTYDWAKDIMYMSSSSNQNLMTLNIFTSEWSVIGTYGLATNPVMHGLEYQSSTGKLYGMSGGSSHGYHLYEINKTTGAASFVGSTGLTSFHNLGYNSHNGVMYMTNSNTDSLYTINLATGAATLIGPLGTSTNPNSMAFNHHTGVMYMLDNSTNNLYTLSLTTGAATIVGNVGTSNFLSLAYAPVPEPGTMAALGLGAAALAVRRRRRK